MSVDLENVVEDEIVDETPEYIIGSPEWTPYILSMLTEKEKVDGYPKVVGLRRVIQLVLGTIIVSRPTFIQGLTDVGKPAATVGYEIQLVDAYGNVLTYGAVADAGGHNVEYPFSKYPSAIAETRAEGRALRKALQLDVLVAEELDENSAKTSGIQDAPSGEDYINQNQKNSINVLCMRLDINTREFVIKTLDKVYDNIGQVSYDEAGILMKELTKYQRDKTLIPANFVGFTQRFE